MNELPCPSAVVKVGGSLLDWPELPARLSEFLATLSGYPDRIVLLAGGGRTVDVVRELDSAHNLGQITSHILAIHALDLTARILGCLLPATRLIHDDRELRECQEGRLTPILAPSRYFLMPEPAPGSGLPSSWDVTSDSIAAWLATRLRADRLILIKSTELPPGSSRLRAATLGFVDPIFPEIARSLRRVDYRNLRDCEGMLIDLPDAE